MGMAVMLDEIINYVHSLQNQVDVSWFFKLYRKTHSTLKRFFYYYPDTDKSLLLFFQLSFYPWSSLQQAHFMTSMPRQMLSRQCRCLNILLQSYNTAFIMFIYITNVECYNFSESKSRRGKRVTKSSERRVRSSCSVPLIMAPLTLIFTCYSPYIIARRCSIFPKYFLTSNIYQN